MTTSTLSLNHPHTLKMVHGAEEKQHSTKRSDKISRRKARESSRYPAQDSDEEEEEGEGDHYGRNGGFGYGGGGGANLDLPSFMVGQFPRIRILGEDGKMQDVPLSDASERSAVRTAARRSAKKRTSSKSKLISAKLAMSKKKEEMKQQQQQQHQHSSESSGEEGKKRGTLRTTSSSSLLMQPKRGTVRTMSSPSLLMQPLDRNNTKVSLKRHDSKISNGETHEQTTVWLEQVVRPAMQKHQNQLPLIDEVPKLKKAVSFKRTDCESKPVRETPELDEKKRSLQRSLSYKGTGAHRRPERLDEASPVKHEKKSVKLKRSQSYRVTGNSQRLPMHPERRHKQQTADIPRNVSVTKSTEERLASLRLKPLEFSLDQLEHGPSSAEPRHLYYAERRISERFLPDTKKKTENPIYFFSDEQDENRPSLQRRPLPDIILNGVPASSAAAVKWYSCNECQHRMACIDGTVALQCPHCRSVVLPN